jgi:hypothetical protein
MEAVLVLLRNTCILVRIIAVISLGTTPICHRWQRFRQLSVSGAVCLGRLARSLRHRFLLFQLSPQRRLHPFQHRSRATQLYQCAM